MSVSVKWPPLTAPNVDHYNIYRGDAQTGPFSKIGETDQPAEPLPDQLQYLDTAGNSTKWYIIEPVDLDLIPGIATGPFQVQSNAVLNRVWDRILNASQQPVSGVRVEARLSKACFFNNLIVPVLVSTVTDLNGFWYLDLYPNSLLDPNDSDYTFLIPNVQPAKRGVVPVGQTILFKDVVGA